MDKNTHFNTKKELGDLLMHSNGNIGVVSKIEQGRGFACKIGNSEYLWSYNNSFSPIPLTEKLLFANGFRYGDFHGLANKDGFRINIGQDKGFWLKISDKVVSIYYVHELQQLLRICGLIELANNFKVEE